MVLLRVFLAVFFFLWGFNRPIRADTVLIVTPENEASLTLAAELYRTAQATDQSQDKERLLRESIDAYPEIAAAYNNLAMLIFERQERDEALQLLERGLQAAEATQDWENMANIHNNLGFITRERGKWSVAYSLEALQHFEKALEISPEFVGALYNKASVLLALRRDMESKEQLLKVLELEPDDRQAHLDLGRIYFEHGDLEKALEHEDYVIKVATTAKEKLQGMHNKGVFLKEYNLLSRALEVYDAMLTIESVESYVLIDMMNAKRSFCDWKGMEKLENQALEDFESAKAEFYTSLQLNASNRMAISKLSEIYTNQKAFDNVVDLYATYGEAAYSFSGQATSASQDEIKQAYMEYSNALDKTGQSLKAIELLEAGVKQHPTIFKLRYNLGVLYNELRRYDQGNQQQFDAVVAQARYLFETQGRHFQKIPRPDHKVVVAFYCHEYGQAWWGKWGPTSLNSGLGGSEEAVVFLSRELQKLGYWVEIYGDPSPQDISTLDQADEDNVRWYPHYTYDINDKGVDIFVAWRYHISMAMGRAARKKFLWMHDLPQEDARRSPELLNNADGIFCLSEFHAAVFPEILQSKITVSTNAVDRSFFVNGPNHADRFVYGSSPSRGLYPLLKAWPRIREKIPTAELSVFYGFTPAFMKWGNSEMTNFTEWMNEMNRLVTETPGVRYVGLANHAQLAKEYSYAGFYLYPTTFSETSCISLMKAMANGAIPITSRFPLSALPETVDDFDLGPRALQHHAIDDDPEWLELWIQSIVDAAHNEQQATTVRHRMKRFARKKYRWEHIALQWHRVISKPKSP
ncbi:hypothetical protein JG687_00001665 [Phytophthora cactorum]|uniref:Uncharacterized protein n=1 Tax=Phytophthora cactorum TaxID=29920 RepID=A0A8T1UWN0_9STRA|nr:hypothetical protein JG687_00001665 [Phytophthora cactorum]